MNFFEAQDRARKSSRLLVWWFLLSVIGVIVVMYFVAIGVTSFSTRDSSGTYAAPEIGWWDPSLFGVVSVVVGGVIMIGSWIKLAQLSGGGKVVAQSLGGRQVEPTTTDLSERRLLNVVEEMAIASGLPVPEVWIMDEEDGINAFAAGTDPSNAVVGVTRGTLERLTRAELQGVVAHEFSHILNGDMKLNMRLMGWIFRVGYALDAGTDHAGIVSLHAWFAGLKGWRNRSRDHPRRTRCLAGRIDWRVVCEDAAGSHLPAARILGGCLGGPVYEKS